MTGAMAGSTAIRHHTLSEKLRVVTLTINNKCTLHCPHCYLQYDGPNVGFNDSILNSILESSAHHIAIVGKEPLVDADAIRATEEIVSLCVSKGKTVSLVTNGLGLKKLSASTLDALEWIDVSLDGGPLSYSQYRSGDFTQVLHNVRGSLSAGAHSINALHTLSTQNLENIDDMMSISQLTNWDKIIFSPYTPEQIHSENLISSVSLQSILLALRNSERFLNHSSSYLLVGSHSFVDQGLDAEAVKSEINECGMTQKVIFIEQDPLLLGYIRVTYDGYFMTPYQSLYPANYTNVALPLQNYTSLDSAFQFLRAA